MSQSCTIDCSFCACFILFLLATFTVSQTERSFISTSNIISVRSTLRSHHDPLKWLPVCACVKWFVSMLIAKGSRAAGGAWLLTLCLHFIRIVVVVVALISVFVISMQICSMSTCLFFFFFYFFMFFICLWALICIKHF